MARQSRRWLGVWRMRLRPVWRAREPPSGHFPARRDGRAQWTTRRVFFARAPARKAPRRTCVPSQSADSRGGPRPVAAGIAGQELFDELTMTGIIKRARDDVSGGHNGQVSDLLAELLKRLLALSGNLCPGAGDLHFTFFARGLPRIRKDLLGVALSFAQ